MAGGGGGHSPRRIAPAAARTARPFESGRVALTAHRLPERFRASMRERLARMSEPARQVATVGGSLARTFSFSDLATMLGLPVASLLPPVEELFESGIMRERGDQLAFQHDLIREAVRHSTACHPPSDRSSGRRCDAAGGRCPWKSRFSLAALSPGRVAIGRSSRLHSRCRRLIRERGLQPARPGLAPERHAPQPLVVRPRCRCTRRDGSMRARCLPTTRSATSCRLRKRRQCAWHRGHVAGFPMCACTPAARR